MRRRKIDYAHNRYQFEAQRHFGILNDHLANRRYMVGDTYTIVDMDVWGWARMIPFVMGEDAVAKYPNVKRLVDEISARPAAAKAIALKDNFKFKAEMDDEARGNMFKHLEGQGGLSRSSREPRRVGKGAQGRARRLSLTSASAKRGCPAAMAGRRFAC